MTKQQVIQTLKLIHESSFECVSKGTSFSFHPTERTKALDVAIDCVNLVEQYKELGSPSELRAALEFIKEVKSALEQDCAYPEDIEFNIRDAYQEYMDELQLSKDYQNNQIQR